jgi:hypothetical protein
MIEVVISKEAQDRVRGMALQAFHKAGIINRDTSKYDEWCRKARVAARELRENPRDGDEA